jgi:type VI secretion system secreted protein Hcp
MSIDTYMLIGVGKYVKGEATADALEPKEGWMALTSFQLGVTNEAKVGTATTGLTPGGRSSLTSFAVTKAADKASTALFQSCASGRHFDQAEVVVRKSGGDQLGQFIFTDVMIDAFTMASGGDEVIESFSVAYGQVSIEYSTQDTSTGAGTVAGQAFWNVNTASAKA